LGGGAGGAEGFFSHEANPLNSSPATQASIRFIYRFVFGKIRVVNDLKAGVAWKESLPKEVFFQREMTGMAVRELDSTSEIQDSTKETPLNRLTGVTQSILSDSLIVVPG
jgi:hypothetical protein